MLWDMIMKVIFWIICYLPAVNSLAKGGGGSPYSMMPGSYDVPFYLKAEFFLGIGILEILAILAVIMVSLHLEQ